MSWLLCKLISHNYSKKEVYTFEIDDYLIIWRYTCKRCGHSEQVIKDKGRYYE